VTRLGRRVGSGEIGRMASHMRNLQIRLCVSRTDDRPEGRPKLNARVAFWVSADGQTTTVNNELLRQIAEKGPEASSAAA
jgi:hypothetical protein